MNMSKEPQRPLVSRSFIALNLTQFLGALNDNIFKLFVVFAIIRLSGPDSASTVVALSGAIFVLPFLFFSAGAGVLADRVSKRNILVATKVLEIAVMLLGWFAFWLRSPAGLYGALFLMALQSTIFGPAKYGIVPELVGRDYLSRANSALVVLTYLAIIAGSALGPLLAQAVGFDYVRAQWVCVGVALAGTAASLFIRRTPPAGATAGASVLFVRDIWRTLRSIRGDRWLVLAVLASAYFCLLGAFMQMNIIPYGMQYLGLTQEQSGYLFFLAAIGIAAGAVLAGWFSGRDIEFGIVPVGAILLTVSVVALKLLPAAVKWVAPAVFLAGMGVGLFIIPVDSFIQFRAPRDRLGQVLAASGFLSWLGVLVAAGLVFLVNWLGLSAGTGFVLMGLMTLALTWAALRMLPDFLLRFLGLVITRLVFRIRVIGGEHVPIDGAALLVCNHVSWVDALLLLATQQRRIRFIMDRAIYERRLLNPLFRLMGVIPISEKDPPKKIVAALRQARTALDDGFMVCIFAEGAVSRSGMPMAFKSGFEYIVRHSAYPIIPIYIGGAWGSVFSYYYGKPLSRWPTLLRYPVTVLFGAPMPPTATVGEVREAVLELSCLYYDERKPRRRSLGESFVRSARGAWSRHAMSDTLGRKLSFGQALTVAVALAGLLKSRVVGQSHVGILLPSSVGGALGNLAVTLLGRVAVNLNFTVGADTLHSALRQCAARTVISSRSFLEKIGKYSDLPGLVMLEDLLSGLTSTMKLRAWFIARMLPAAWWARPPGFQADDVAAVIFSSGSTGTPKGVMLSHHNILSNIESMRAVFHYSPDDNICAALPFFHSFGYTCSLWLPLLCGFSVAYHPNPLEGAKIAEVVRENHSTLLFATPTFLLAYLRRAKPEDFESLRFVVVGAEKLRPRLADAFEAQFGVRPLEGYGATELSPVAAISLPDVEAGGLRQVGTKAGSVGHPLPGVAVRIVDPETGARVPPETPGLLLIRGPNVMLGYLNEPEKTAAVLRDGWYNTGDMAVLDNDGFIKITDRLSRFSKIGGEMVPHLAVEEAYQRGLERTDPVLAVAGVADEKRGERLVVLYTAEAGPPDRLRAIITSSELPNLWKPAADAYYPIDSLPVLGTGKLDLKAIKDLAVKLAGSAAA